jgi:hypothetical protein
MKAIRLALTIAAALAPLTTLSAQNSADYATRIIIRPASVQTVIGTPAKFTIALANSQGRDVSTKEDVTIEVRSRISNAPVMVPIPAGRSSASFEITPSASGPIPILASARNLAPTSGLVLVKPTLEEIQKIRITSQLAHPVHAPLAQVPEIKVPEAKSTYLPKHKTIGALAGSIATPQATGGQAAPPPSPEPQPAPTPANPVLVPEILIARGPEYDLAKRKWRASVVLATHDAEQHYLAPDSNPNARLIAGIAAVAPPAIVPWDASSPYSAEAELVSSQPGMDTLRVVSRLGAAEAHLAYSLPPATAIVVKAADKVINDGRVKVPVYVRLVDREGNEAPASDHTEIHFSFQQGTGSVEPNPVLIEAGKSVPGASVTVSSARNGYVLLQATALGLADGTAPIHFSFPLRLMVMAAIGAVLGTLVKAEKRSRFSPTHLFTSLCTTVVVGVVFFAVIYLGALSAIPKFTIVNIDKVPTGNELGALVIGFVAGLIGVSIFSPAGKTDSDGDHGDKGKAAGHHGR